jgi:heme exporter protein A
LTGAVSTTCRPARAAPAFPPRSNAWVCRRARVRPCRALSAGQKRRSALARLLLAPRPLWLLDEPLDGLDGAGLAVFADLAATHLDGGGAILMTSHQPLPGALAVRAGERVLGA